MQAPYYAQLLRAEREAAAARVSLAPELKELAEALKGSSDVTVAERAARRLPILLDRLPRGASS